MPQRLVRWHPGSQRHSLYLSSHIGRIQGWQVPEAMALIRWLVEFATQRQFVYAHTWRQWDLVMWDNRATMHRARPYEDNTYPRDLRRVTLTDVAPTLGAADGGLRRGGGPHRSARSTSRPRPARRKTSARCGRSRSWWR